MTLAAALAVACLAAPTRACLEDMEIDDGSPPAGFLYPNWQKVEVADFDLLWCDSITCPPPDNDATIVGVTLVNYGTATGGAAGDITGMYACFDCALTPGPCTPATGVALTYAGIWNEPGGPVPAWTWAGTHALAADPCTTCACVHIMRVFVDVGSCATPGNTVVIGPGYNDLIDPFDPGGIIDDTGCDVPYVDLKDPQPKTITWIGKVGNVATAAPGDTVTYTIYYGRPGAGVLANIIVMDSLPPYTHYVSGSGVPAPDPGWEPDSGPPTRVRWTLAGGATTGGPTGAVVFSVTVDWGNGEAFEPGSGDLAAPEGARLNNIAAVSFVGTSCATKGAVSPPVPTVVKRFLFWKMGDNDLLFAPQPGQPPDEMTYSIFLQNTSSEKTWWNVQIWDTAPPEINPWAPNEGLNDPCQGWTMTPSGCAAASAGVIVTGGKTILTWKLNMEPGMTVELQWKGQVRSSVSPGATALNRASVLELGRTGVLDGTGSSKTPVSFTHSALIILPTTYVSYVGFAANGNDKEGCPGFFISFFPLNKQTQFELRGIQYQGAGWATTGGASNSIGCLIGDCLTGFPGAAGCTLGSGAISGGGNGGCKVERAPAQYNPSAWVFDNCPTYPNNFIYKVTSNSPVLWQLLTHISHDAQDSDTWAPSTTITYRGFMHYMYRRAGTTGNGDGDSAMMINTGMDAGGVVSTTQTTTVHMFKWDVASLQWDYWNSWDLGGESMTVDMGPDAVDEGPYRTISSDTQLIIYESFDTLSQGFSSGCGDNYISFGPTRETGNTTSQVGSGTFYGQIPGWAGSRVVVGNTGALAADYRLWRYNPDNPVAVGNLNATEAGTSGSWSLAGTGLCPPGFLAAGNPQIHGSVCNAAGYSLWKVELTAGGPIQVLFGANLFQGWSGGTVIHAADGNQTGSSYWLHTISGGGGPCGPVTQVVNIFAPKKGMVIQGYGETGLTASYTTTGPDQCVAFTPIPNAASKMNYQFKSLTGASVVAQFIMCKLTEKGYTAPFLQTGVHYTIIAPPIVFSGQSFWITVLVIDSTNVTRDDYCGTTAFSSTDPSAKIAGTGMALYNYTWSSQSGICGSSPWDNGVKVFVNVVFNVLGIQTLMATDTSDGSIAGLTSVMVVSADVKLTKNPRISVAASGDTVKFTVCWSNYSSASAFTFVITDAVPMGTTFIPEVAATALDCGNTDGLAVSVAYTTVTSATMPGAASFTGANPLAGTRWLRWTVPMTGVQTTGCACFRVKVD